MGQPPGMGIQERYGGFKGRGGKSNQGGGGGGSRFDRTLPLLAQNDEGVPDTMMDFPPQPYDYAQTPPYNRGDNRAPPGSDEDFATLNESDQNDFATVLDYAIAVPRGADYVRSEESAPFMASPEGKLAQDLFAAEGLSESTVLQVKQLWDKFHAQQQTIPTLPTTAGGGMGDIPR